LQRGRTRERIIYGQWADKLARAVVRNREHELAGVADHTWAVDGLRDLQIGRFLSLLRQDGKRTLIAGIPRGGSHS
jgi:hypothetical protein